MKAFLSATNGSKSILQCIVVSAGATYTRYLYEVFDNGISYGFIYANSATSPSVLYELGDGITQYDSATHAQTDPIYFVIQSNKIYALHSTRQIGPAEYITTNTFNTNITSCKVMQ